MKKSITLFLGLAFVIAGRAQNYKLPAGIQSSDYLAKTIIIKVKDTYRSSCSEQGVVIPALQKSLNTIGTNSLVKKFRNELPPREKYSKEGYAYADLSLIYECKYTSGTSIEKAINSLLASGALVYAEPHFVPKIDYNPNDPQSTVSLQYHINKINAYNAWNVNKGDSNVIIGITDTGTEPTHPDLGPNIKHNYADPINGIDDDGDTYVDNFSGWDLGVNDNDPTWQGNPHGVHVSGIASAATDNAVGVAGIGFKCMSLPVKIADAAGNLIAAYEGIKYAADHGCAVINCSWGGAGGGQYGQDICTYAVINKNALVVAASGNNGLDQEFFPAAYEYVLAVANTQANDVINTSSNYGYFIDVCAPGTNINATWNGGSYSQQTGTSMSSPVVAGAAGIVKSHYPTYTAMQVGQRLKTTADNIYSLTFNNLAFHANKLGTGRINLNRALTDPLTPSVVMHNVKVADKNDGFFLGGDTLSISGDFVNYLAATAALNGTLVPLSGQASAISNVYNMGVINTLAMKTNSATPFTFALTGTFTSNQALVFRLDLQDGSYTSSQFLTVNANADYLNIYINDVGSTATSKGKIGYNQDNQVQGLGFVYNGVNELWDAGLLIGIDPTKVSDCVRGTAAGSDVDFGVLATISKISAGAKSDFDTYAKFNDAVSTTPIGIEVEQRNFAWSAAPNKKFIIWEYVIKNTTAGALNNLYAGIFADWDIDATTFANNKSAYDAANKMGYTWCTNAGGKFTGIKLLTPGTPMFYAFDNISGGGGGIDISAGYSTSDKYAALSSNRLTAGGAGTGNDVINQLSSGPHNLLAGQSVTVAFALIAGDDLSDIQSSAANAQIKYNGITSSAKEITMADNSIILYPNPAVNELNLQMIKESSYNVAVYDQTGKLIFNTENVERNLMKINTANWARGLYFVKVSSEKGASTTKIVLE
jgi:serine protease